ncbi:MAG: hypothetical protein JWM74_4815, partial [Myxococcaceae bacterium]|nr:hypothetical protein [Myxococcaceae bacterium]
KGMTIADVALSAWLMWIDSAKIPVAPYANINKWFAKMTDLDAWKKTGVGK